MRSYRIRAVVVMVDGSLMTGVAAVRQHQANETWDTPRIDIEPTRDDFIVIPQL